MTANTPTLVTFAIYLIGMLLIGWMGYRATSNLSDYILGGRSLGSVVTALSAGASDMSGWLLMGLPGAVFLSGLSEAWIAIGLCMGAWLNWRVVAARLRVYTEKVGNALTYAHAGMIVLGEKLPGEITPRVQAVADFLNAHGVTAKPVGDMVRRQWGKLMLNVGLNQTVMVFEGDYGTVQQPGKPRDIMIAAMREVQKLAAMEGYPISDEEFDDWVKLADSLSPAGKPSMRQDGEAHRKSEVELFAGTIIRRAARFGLDVPVNRWLYDTVKKMEAAY